MKIVYTGLESSGKSLMMARMAYKIYKRDAYWLRVRDKLKLEHVPRTMAFNQPMSDDFIHLIEDAGLVYKEWRSFYEIERLVESDIFIDELLKVFPSRGSDPLPPHVMDFLTQGAKSGNHIYASSQDFSQVHKQFRLLTNKVYVVKKIIGSPRPMNSAPPVNFVWGICLRNSVKPSSFKGDNATMETDWMPIPFWISLKDARRYNTLYKLPASVLPDVKLRSQRIFHIQPDGTETYIKTVHK